MFIETETVAPIKNLENQIRLFVYDFTSFTCPHHFVLMTNLLTYVTPIQYLFKEFMTEMDDEREEELKLLILDHLWLVVRDFRLLSQYVGNEERVQDIWYSLYQAYEAIEEWTDSECGMLVEEFVPFIEAE